jgi:hypothetical protein
VSGAAEKSALYPNHSPPTALLFSLRFPAKNKLEKLGTLFTSGKATSKPPLTTVHLPSTHRNKTPHLSKTPCKNAHPPPICRTEKNVQKSHLL